MTKKYLKYILLFTTLLFLIPTKVLAFCPVCSIEVGAGVGLSRWLKIDDTITGLWIGAFIISLILWTLGWLKNKKWNFKGDAIVIFLVYYAIIIIPLYYKEIIGHPLNKILGIDKLLFGIGVGSIVFLISIMLYNYLKKLNQGKSYFKLQKILTPIVLLAISSLIFYLITKK